MGALGAVLLLSGCGGAGGEATAASTAAPTTTTTAVPTTTAVAPTTTPMPVPTTTPMPAPTTTTTVAPTTTTVVDGAVVYAAQCAVCHGPDREGGVGPALVGHDSHLDDHDADEIAATIAGGADGMPAFADLLAEEEIQAVVDYLVAAAGR